MTKNKGKKKAVEPAVIATIIVAVIGAFASIIVAGLNSKTQIELKEIELTQGAKSTTQTIPPQAILIATETSLSITGTASLIPSTPAVFLEPTVCITDNSLGWEFEIDGNTEGWENGRRLPDTTTRDGNLVATFAERDPYWNGPNNLTFEASSYSVLEIRYRINAYDDTAQFMWTTDLNSENQLKEFEITTDDNWHVAVVELPVNTNWFGSVTSLRYDPVKDAPSGTIEVDYIRLCHPK